MVHHKAVDNMKAKTLRALQDCTVKDRWPVFASYTQNVAKLAEEAVKHKKEWLTSSNVYSIFASEVSSAIRPNLADGQEFEGQLTDLLDGDIVSSLAERIVEIILSVPRAYVFYFPLPYVHLQVNESLQIGEGIFLQMFGPEQHIPGGEKNGLLGAFGTHLERNKLYLCIEEKGFTSGDIDDIVFNHALSKFKILTHLLIIRGTLSERSISPVVYGLGGTSHYVPNLVSTIFDTERPDEIHATTLLPIGVSRHADKLCLNEENKSYLKAKAEEQVGAYIQSMSSHPALLLKHSGEDSVPIRSAIEWAYEASTTDNDTIAFIQVCIGLEAILGDDTSTESISATLADRCAYLLGNDIQGRKTIRENFRELYKRRSKIAHGRTIRLKPDESGYLNWGKNVLNYLILKEMKHLNLTR